ncbi:MAG: polyhydroxyalkanoic acid system family protein [Deltaproteobacteria bacterium]|nr:polyhydroxyalkanoic acid system family protein [Deltaproteobacteria bacterium]
MAAIDISRTHALGKEEAKKRADQMLVKLQEKMGIKGTWADDVFNITAPVTGTFKVTETNVRIELELSFMMRAMKGTIEGKINESLDKALS